MVRTKSDLLGTTAVAKKKKDHKKIEEKLYESTMLQTTFIKYLDKC